MEFWRLDLVDILSISALILGPLGAVVWLSWGDKQVRKEANLRDEKLEKKNRQTAIFQNLMTNRSSSTQQIFERVEATNLVPVVFYGDKKIHECWSLYIDSIHVKPWGWAEIKNAAEEYQNLLKSIADHLGYQFSHDNLDRGYYPDVTEIIYQEEQIIRKGLVKLFFNGQPLPIAVKEFPQPGQQQPALASFGSLSQPLK